MQPLDEDYFMYCEDVDFSLRLLEKSIDILYVPKAHLWHKVAMSSGGEGSSFSEYYMARNSFLYLRKHRNFFAITALPYINKKICQNDPIRFNRKRAVEIYI